jgi:hypothetical protein
VDTKENMERLKYEAYLLEMSRFAVPYELSDVSEYGTVSLQFAQRMTYSESLSRFSLNHLDLSLIKAGTDRPLSLNWTLLAYNNATNTISLRVYYPDAISQGQELDVLRAQFLRSKFFSQPISGLYPSASTKIDASIPPQVN